MKPSRNLFVASCRGLAATTAVITLSIAPDAFAASATWKAVATDVNWTTAANWANAVPGGIRGGNSTNADVVTFNAASNFQTITIDNARFVNSIAFGAGAGAYSFNGGLLYLSQNGSISLAAGVTNPQVFSNTWQAQMTSSNNGVYTFLNNATDSAVTLTFNATTIVLTNGNGRPTTLNLDGSNTGENIISSNMTNATGSQPVNVMNKNGAGTWVLSGANNFTYNTSSGAPLGGAAFAANGVQVNAGTLVVANNAALGTDGTANRLQTSVNNTGTLQLRGGITIDNGVSLNLNNGGTIASNGTNGTNGRINVATTAALSSTLATISASDVFTIGNAANEFTGGASDSVIHIGGPGTVSLPQSGNYVGAMSIDAGSLLLGNATALGSSAGVTFGAASTGRLVLNGLSPSLASLSSASASGTVENSNAAAATLTVNKASGSSTFSGTLQNGAAAGALALTKSGLGSLILGGASTYSGGTTISGGSLIVTNTTGTGTGTGAVAVNAGAFGGTGSASGAVTVAANASIAPGNGGIGTVGVGSLTLNANSQLDFDITSAASLDHINVNGGSLTINGGQLNINGGTSSFAVNGTYNLISGYSGSIGGTGVSALAVNGSNIDVTKTYSFSENGGAVVLTVANAGSTPSYWNVDANGSWNPGTWTAGTPNAVGAFAGFGGGGAILTAPRTVSVSSNVTTGTIAFNSANAYTLGAGGGMISLNNGTNGSFVTDTAGSHNIAAPLDLPSNGAAFSVSNASDTLTVTGSISGTGGLSKSGLGKLVLNGANFFSGAVSINAGTLSINSEDSLVDPFTAATVTTIGPATLQVTADVTTARSFDITSTTSQFLVDSTRTYTVLGAVGSSGTLNKTGGGTLVLNGTNSYSGGTIVSGGTLGIMTDASLGAIPGAAAINLTLVDGATLLASGTATLAVTRNVALSGAGATIDTSSNNLTVGGGVSGVALLTKSGSGTLTLNGANTYSGGTLVNGGTFSIGTSVAGGITLANGTTLRCPAGGAGNAITLTGANASATVTAVGIANGYGGNITGGADQTLVVSGGQVSFGSTTKQFQPLAGTVSIASGATLRLSATSLNNGGDSTTFDVTGGLTTRNNGNVALGALTGTGTVAMGGAGGNNLHTAFTIGAKGINTTFSGTIIDGDAANGKIVDIVKTGAGIQTLSGNNTYTGTTAVNAGTLQIGDGGTSGKLGAGNVTVTANLSFKRSDAVTVSNTITGVGTIEQNGAGNLTLNGADAAGSLLVHHGTLTIGSGGSMAVGNFLSIGNQTGDSGTLTVETGATLTAVLGVGDLNVSDLGGSTGVLNVNGGSVGSINMWVGKDFLNEGIGGTGIVNQSGGSVNVAGFNGLVLGFNMGSSGTYHLDGGTLTTQLVTRDLASNATGNFHFNGGTLVASSSSGAFMSDLTVLDIQAGGAFIDSTGNDIGIPQPITNGGGGGGLTKLGSGTLTLGSANTYTGTTTVNGGVLSLAAASLADSSTVAIASGAQLNLSHGATDEVAFLKFNNVSQPAGIYNAANSGGYITGSGSIKVLTGTVSGYGTWASTHAGGGAAKDDADNDGVSNGVEYFMNAAPGSTANPQLVGTTITWPNGGNIPNSDYGTQFVVQVSTDLINWTDVPSNKVNLANPAAVSYSLTGPAPKFTRLKVMPN